MNKTDMAAKLARKTGISQAKAGECLNALFGGGGIIAKELADGEGKVQISGFGTFSRKTRAARTGKNPQTGEAMELPAKDYPHFKAGKSLREMIDG